MHSAGLVLGWAANRGIEILGIEEKGGRLDCSAVGVTAGELGRRADLLVSLGGDGTMLRAMRLADGQRAPVLGVNLGKMGFLEEVDVPEFTHRASAWPWDDVFGHREDFSARVGAWSRRWTGLVGMRRWSTASSTTVAQSRRSARGRDTQALSDGLVHMVCLLWGVSRP